MKLSICGTNFFEDRIFLANFPKLETLSKRLWAGQPSAFCQRLTLGQRLRCANANSRQWSAYFIQKHLN
ncbi:MAG: hypothetical protein F6K37_06675 [Moorea sp. SIO4E2]|uniref:hypothetical protein n=1 Tax=Moorena sp. SIO4E2 TaxID=2607826 RepID=UPI0013B91DFF|nr:hypothetical protein [Moorena sp. SIO4E2]NEQ05654.1 hypothetical protein [Moorena sp. SIO4E2]